MAEQYGFFDGGSLYGQDEFNRYFDNIYKSGVSIDDNNNMTLACSVLNNTVTVGKGFAIVKGFFYYNDTNKEISVIRDANYSRIDRVVIRLNLTSKTVKVELKNGVASSNPVAPTLQRDNSIYELSLCKLTVPVTGNITIADERFDVDLCGSIRPKNLSEIETMIAQYQKNWKDWFNTQQSQGWRQIDIQSEVPTNRVEGGVWIKLI